MKKFLKPSLEKILLFIILMGGVNLYIILTYEYKPTFGGGIDLIGKPLGFYSPLGTTYWNPAVDYSLQNPSSIYPGVIFNFVIDLIFWYLVSALIVWVYQYLKSKHTI